MKYTQTKVYKRKRKSIVKSLKSLIKFDKKIAMRLSDSRYYAAMGQDIIQLDYREKAKVKYSTPLQDRVTALIKKQKEMLHERSKGVFHTLAAIYNRNKVEASRKILGKPPIHTKIHSLVCSIPVLMTAYAKIRKNKGATTLAAMLSFDKMKHLKTVQRRFLSRTVTAPDGISYEVFRVTSELLKKGIYPWGASRRIYIDKPGQPDKKRPITIPPFMDRVVQTAILRVLESIYEPWFERNNRSFSFRPNKGVHDAIYNLIRKENRGLFLAIEGDIKGAYDNVIKEKLLAILSKRINDRKFMNLMEKRLDYIYYDTEKRRYLEDKKGIPQGGIDSPYLWNIYMHEFDLHIDSYLTTYLNDLNSKVRGEETKKGYAFLDESRRALINERTSVKAVLTFVKKHLSLEAYQSAKLGGELKGIKATKRIIALYNDLENFNEFRGKKYLKKEIQYGLIKVVNQINHKLRKLPPADQNRLRLRHVYCRYADDWIILGNFNKNLAEKIKSHISTWLKENLGAVLSAEKTIITDIREEPAHFLGFEIKSRINRKFSYRMSGNATRKTLVRVAGQEVNAWPDKQRLISRLHMKGYCKKNGQPTGLRWLAPLETFILISRFNAVLRGLANYYNGFIHFPSALSRWIFIIRRSLLNTLGRKFDCSAKKIYKRFGIKTRNGQTIRCIVNTTETGRGKITSYRKDWYLMTYRELIHRPDYKKRFEKIEKIFDDIEYRQILPSYNSLRNQFPVVTNDDYLDKIIWVNLRTHASFDLPCSLCGTSQDIEMHHIKHIRKTPLFNLPENKFWLKAMSLRNRNQIPVCRSCHMDKIHKGTYDGSNLKTLNPQINLTRTGYDVRLVNIENQLRPSTKGYHGKSLTEKGWKITQRIYLTKKYRKY